MQTRSQTRRNNNIRGDESGRDREYCIIMPDNNVDPTPTDTPQLAELMETLRVERERVDRQRTEWDAFRMRLISEMAALRESDERQKREILYLKEENQRMRNSSATSDEGNQNTMMLSGLVRGINSMNINMKPPRFGADLSSNPHEFIEQVEKYFLIKKIPYDSKILVVETLLENRARDWYRAQAASFQDFEQFKIAFW